MNKFERDDNKGRRIAKRIIYFLPNVGLIIDNPPKDEVDLKVESGRTYVPTEVKLRESYNEEKEEWVFHSSTDYEDGRIQQRKYEAIMNRGGGFLIMIFKDKYFLWDLTKTKPKEYDKWGHSKTTSERGSWTKDDYVAFDYNEALYSGLYDPAE